MIIIMFVLIISGCSQQQETHPVILSAQKGSRDNTPVVLTPTASQVDVIGNSTIQFDVSNSHQGYVIVTYSGSNSKVKVRIYNPNQEDPYTYDIKDGQNVLPLTGGSGVYTFKALENIRGNEYSTLFNQQKNITIENDYITYLYPNQYVNFSTDSKVVEVAQSLVEPANNDLEAVMLVYNYVTQQLSYDDDKAKLAKEGEIAGYLPDVDQVLSEKKGICFDYASLMAAMLRSQNIPTRLEMGYVTMKESIYHAWISVYIEDIGWIDNLIEFDGQSWSMMDPTLISDGNNSESIRKVVKNKDNYTTRYIY